MFPLVSICTPTKDRLGFLALLRRCIEAQRYPLDRVEWIVVDDGLQSAGPVCEGFANARHIRLDPALRAYPLGLKRNLADQMAQGEIVINMDDDDYQPPTRISHAVKMLEAHPDRLVAGCGELPIYFADRDEIWHLGPFGPNRATAGTFAFRHRLLAETAYDNLDALSEEGCFLRGHSIPMVPLDPTQTLLALSHAHNTFDKRVLLKDPEANKVRRLEETLADVIEDPDLRASYLDVLK